MLLGDREVVVSREMTKIYEEFLRGPAGGGCRDGEGAIRGEVTLIVAGRSGAVPEYSDAELLRLSEQCGRKREKNCPSGTWRTGLRRRQEFPGGGSTVSYYSLELLSEV